MRWATFRHELLADVFELGILMSLRKSGHSDEKVVHDFERPSFDATWCVGAQSPEFLTLIRAVSEANRACFSSFGGCEFTIGAERVGKAFIK